VFVPVVNILFYCFAIFLGDYKLEIVHGRGQKPVYKCSLTNDADEHATTIENCELLIDSGNTACDLLCTWRDAQKFNLHASIVKQTVTCANDGEEVIVQLVPQLLVKFSLVDNDQRVKVKSAHLDVWVMEHELPTYVERPLWTPPSNQSIEETQTPTAHCATSPAVNKACPEKKVSPVKHTPYGMANLGKSGCKKLCLKYDFANDYIFFIEQNKEDYQEI
jgi:hypothetical protein